MALRQIINKKTGEVRMVNDEELGDYGIVKKPKPPGLIGMEDTSDLYKTDFSLPQTIRSVPKEKSLLEQFYDYQVPSGGFTGQGLVSNLKSDVGNLVTGVKSIPKVAKALYKEPAKIPEAAFAVGKGILEDYGNLLTRPVRTLYERPVTGALDVASIAVPAIKAAKAQKAAKAAKVAQMAALENVTRVGPEDVDEVVKALAKAEDTATDISKALVKGGKAGPSAGKINYGARIYANLFTIPTKRAKELQPLNVAQDMVNYGIKGSLDDMVTISNRVTGSNGILAKVARGALGMFKKDVSVDDVVKKMDDVAKQSLSVDPTETKRLARLITEKIKIAADNTKTMDAGDAFDLAQKLEAKAHQYKNASTYLTRNIKAEELGDIYEVGAKVLLDKIEKGAQQADLLKAFRTPEIMQALNDISPLLARRFANIKTFRELRSLQAPFVRLGKMADLTMQAGQSAAVKAATGITTAAGMAATGGALFGVPGAIIGAIGAPVVAPIIQGAAGVLAPKVGSAVAVGTKAVKAAGETAGRVTRAAGQAARNAAIMRALLRAQEFVPTEKPPTGTQVI